MKLKVTITGSRVQGVGYRPYLAELAMRLALRGFEVFNEGETVVVLLESDDRRVKEFFKRATLERPSLALVDTVKSEEYAGDVMPLWQFAFGIDQFGNPDEQGCAYPAGNERRYQGLTRRYPTRISRTVGTGPSGHQSHQESSGNALSPGKWLKFIGFIITICASLYLIQSVIIGESKPSLWECVTGKTVERVDKDSFL